MVSSHDILRIEATGFVLSLFHMLQQRALGMDAHELTTSQSLESLLHTCHGFSLLVIT